MVEKRRGKPAEGRSNTVRKAKARVTETPSKERRTGSERDLVKGAEPMKVHVSTEGKAMAANENSAAIPGNHHLRPTEDAPVQTDEIIIAQNSRWTATSTTRTYTEIIDETNFPYWLFSLGSQMQHFAVRLKDQSAGSLFSRRDRPRASGRTNIASSIPDTRNQHQTRKTLTPAGLCLL